MTDLKATIIDRRNNEITFALDGGTGTGVAIVASYGKTAEHFTELTVSFRDIETGEAPVLPINGIDYEFRYGTGRIYDDNRTQATQADLRRSVAYRRADEGYFGTPPTEKARSAAYGLVRDILSQVAADGYLETFLAAGVQKKAASDIKRLQREIAQLHNEYVEKVGELLTSVDAANANLTGATLDFPHPTWDGSLL
jgi:hypothetical protein